MTQWKPKDAADRDLAVDRILEILAYRASHAWKLALQKHPSLPQVSFTLAASAQSTRLLTGRVLSEAPLPSSKNFVELSDAIVFRGKTRAQLIRKAMRRRFGHTQCASRWPALPMKDGHEAVLHALMTSAHHARREAAILGQSTAGCEVEAAVHRF